MYTTKKKYWKTSNLMDIMAICCKLYKPQKMGSESTSLPAYRFLLFN